MKKIFIKAGACLLAVSVFFNFIFIQPVYGFTLGQLAAYIAWTAVGYAVNEGVDELFQTLGWTEADIQVDENGNVIISEAQMQELKDALKTYTEDENGNDKYGMWLYSSTTSLPSNFNEIVYGDHKNTELADVYMHSGTWWGSWGVNSDSYITAVVNGSDVVSNTIWVGTDGTEFPAFYLDSNPGGSTTNLTACSVYTISNSAWTWQGYRTSSWFVNRAHYYGGDHVVFGSTDAYAQWKLDGKPYTLVEPTYTDGDLVIPADELKDTDGDGVPDGVDDDDDGDGIPDDEDDDPLTPLDPDDTDGNGIPDADEIGEDTSTELGVLQAILKWIKKIYNQVVVGNIVNAIDAFAQVMDTVDEFIDDALEDVASVTKLSDLITTKFPFCLPGDILLILSILEAEPQTPVFEIPFRADFGGATGISVDEVFVLDFSMFEDAINVLKWWLSIMWIYALVLMTPKYLNIGSSVSGGSG